MSENYSGKKLYIVISQTGTAFSRILRFITGEEYNHASISLEDDLSLMYSFGRVNPYNPFFGGFVTESPNFGTFKRFSNTKVIVLSIDISDKTYYDMADRLKDMYERKDEYSYNYLGVYLAAFKIHRKKKNCYYCSEFVRDFLQNYSINGSLTLNGIVHPMDFLKIPDSKDMYYGKLKDFGLEKVNKSI